MAIWNIIDTKAGALDPTFDDGNDRIPGEDGFTTEIVESYAGPANYNYSSTPNWSPLPQPEEEGEEQSPA